MIDELSELRRRLAGWIEVGRTDSTNPIGWVLEGHLGPRLPKRAAPWTPEGPTGVGT
jgi:hypothetical protein